MMKTELCDLLGIKYPIIQAGMGPFGTNKLCIAAANTGVLGLISSSGIATKNEQPGIYNYFVETGGGSSEDDQKTVLKKIFRQTLEKTREKKGIFGVNVMVAVEMKDWAELIIDTMIELREQDPEMKERFKILVTSAGDPLPWTPKVKKAGLLWMHVIPSVKGALRCQKAGVDAVVASGAQMGTRFLATQESDFHPMWKEGVVKAGDRGTLVARGFVGPARFLKTPVSLKHQENTLKMSPGVFLGKPDDYSTVPMELINSEIAAMNAVYAGDETKALLAGGECAQRIQDLPTVEDLVKRIVREAEEVLAKMPGRLA